MEKPGETVFGKYTSEYTAQELEMLQEIQKRFNNKGDLYWYLVNRCVSGYPNY